MNKFFAFSTSAFFCLATLSPLYADQREANTPYYAVALTADGRGITSLQLDSLGKDAFRSGALTKPAGRSGDAARYLARTARVEDGDRILFPMLKSYSAGARGGRGPNWQTYDWQAWDGTPSAYEGFAADCFMTPAVVAERPARAHSQPASRGLR
jgi:hypothetical protein